MPRFKKAVPGVHQVTIDEYIKSQEELFPDGPPAPASAPYTQPWRVGGKAPVFPGAVDGLGASPGASVSAQVVYSRYRRREK